MTRNWPGGKPRSAAALACFVEPLELFLILLRHHLPFHFQRRRQFATLWRKIGWRNNKLFDGFIGGQLGVELGNARSSNCWICGCAAKAGKVSAAIPCAWAYWRVASRSSVRTAVR